MYRVLKCLMLFCAFSLIGAACSGGDTRVPAASDSLSTGEAPDDLAMVDQDDANRDDDGPTDEAGAGDTTADDTPAMVDADNNDAENNDAEDDDGDLLDPNANERIGQGDEGEDQAEPAAADRSGPLPDGVDEATALCVDDALASDPGLGADWDELLDSSGASAGNVDSSALLEPILECLSFGEAVAIAVSNAAGLNLSSESISCINNDVGDAEDDLLEAIAGPGSIDQTLITALVSCVSSDELLVLMTER